MKLINTYIRISLISGVMTLVSLSALADMAYKEMPLVAVDDYKTHIILAERGDAESERIIGDCFLTGVGTKKDVNEAWR